MRNDIFLGWSIDGSNPNLGMKTSYGFQGLEFEKR
jgi:hypothetical protein